MTWAEIPPRGFTGPTTSGTLSANPGGLACHSKSNAKRPRAADVGRQRRAAYVGDRPPRGDFSSDPAVSAGIDAKSTWKGDASEEPLRELAAHAGAIAEIPNSLRRGTPVQLTAVRTA